MKIRVPLYVKIMMPLVALIILTVGISGYRVYQESTEHFAMEMDTRLERVAKLVAQTVDTHTLMLIQTPLDINTPAYAKIYNQLSQAATAGNLGWVGIYYRQGDYLYYWVDSSSTGVGYPAFYATADHFAVYDDLETHRVRYSDEYGLYYGFVMPITVKLEDGQPWGFVEPITYTVKDAQTGEVMVYQVIGLVEAVLSGESTQLLRRETLNRVLPILVGGSLVAILLSALIAILAFNRPLQKLEQGALTLASGIFGHTIELHTNDELGDLAAAFNKMSLQLESLYRERAERERMQRELEIARNVQQSLFPAQLPQVEGLLIAAFCRPHRETSGDFYDLIVLGHKKLGVVVGDVSGKSIPAAMLMVSAHSTIRSEAFDHDAPATVLDESNRMLCRNIPRGMFVAASYATIDATARRMIWANAGQIYPFLLHRLRPVDQEYPRYLETSGAALPLGMDPAVAYETQSLFLQPGDTVLFYTDGVVEAMNPAHELYGFERLERLVQSLPPGLAPRALIDAVLEDVARFVGPAEQHDDITIVAVQLAERHP